MKENNSAKPLALKSLPLKSCADTSDHDYSTPMETATASNNIQDRGTTTPADTPEKIHMEKKMKGMSQEETNTETILKAVNSLGQRVDDRMEEVSKQMQQHSSMLAAIAKMVQLNSEELKECKMKIKHLEKQVETLTKENEDMKGRILNNDRYKRRWCLCIKGTKEKNNENIRAEVVKLLSKIAPDLEEKMDEAFDVVHRVGRMIDNRHR